MRRASACVLLVALAGGCGSSPPPRVATPVPPSFGAVPLPPAHASSGVPAALRDAGYFFYPDNDVLRADLSSLGDFYLKVESAGDGDEVVLHLHAQHQAATVRVDLMHHAYEPPSFEYEYGIEDLRADALYVRVEFPESDGSRYQIALFRIGDELRAASRPAGDDDRAWKVFQVIRLASRAAIHPLYPDPH